MRIDVVLPNESATADPETITELAVTAEGLGYHTAWLPDHVLPPANYGPDRYGGVYEPLITLAYLAARTTRLRLGTSVLVLPLRNPFVVAKQVATLQRLSRGRAVLGVGIGWDAVEFANVGADFTDRAGHTDEAITLIRHLFTTDEPFHGPRFGFRTGVFEPRPVGQVPIMVGGVSNAALRRAGRLADEWQAVNLDPDRFQERVAYLRRHATREVSVGTRITWSGDLDPAAVATGWSSAGADHLAVHFGAVDGYRDRMTAFAEQASLPSGAGG